MTAYDRRLAIGFVPYLVLDWEDAISAFETGGWLLELMAPIYEENKLKFLGPYPEGFGGIATRGRFATSARYQPVSEPIDRAAFNVHMGVAKWEEVYSGWETDDPLKYYWKSIDMDVRKPWTQQ